MALLKKRFLTFRRDKKMWMFVVFMPLLFVGAGTLIVLALEQEDQPALTLSPQVRARYRFFGVLMSDADGVVA